ncbi:GNAT family N-acetyltransferase [Pontibacillus yanchengensis]|uniref:Aminoglycoside adenylyltransferase n=1 Tax=Pontibacillus yanchengensis Y32 TaxID=1385514 RepID=A0A0A2T9Y1_9BACI|nr:GNAT family protein [Pontibacillus yanchengensis]KGP71228.1 aminoglycoside adenylyltransferase [Pontibacillus yanchengensis Y32]
MVRLERFTQQDFDLLLSWVESKTFMHQWTGNYFTYPLTREQLEGYIEGANEPGATKYIYKAVEENTGHTIGHISITKIDWNNQSGRIGRVLIGDKRFLGKGIGKEMVHKATAIAFDILQLHRVSLGVFDFNISAFHTYEKVGYQKEGLLREARKFGDEYWSLIEMSILRREWETSYKTKGRE